MSRWRFTGPLPLCRPYKNAPGFATAAPFSLFYDCARFRSKFLKLLAACARVWNWKAVNSQVRFVFLFHTAELLPPAPSAPGCLPGTGR